MKMAYDFLRMEEGSMSVVDLLSLNENKKKLVEDTVKKITTDIDNLV
jgi:hypothetical protein